MSPGPLPPSMTVWQQMEASKEASVYLAQRMSILMGLDAKTGGRASVPLQTFKSGHTHISGRTNSGKSIAAVLSLILQFIRGYRLDDGTWSKKSPVIVLDLKGDKALFHATKTAAEADGRRFRFLSDQAGDGYYFFDPFQMLTNNPSLATHYAAAWVRALGLDYGLTYGGKYFTDQNIVLLTQAFEDMIRRGSRHSLTELSANLSRHAAKKTNADARHIALCLKMLTQYPQVNIDLHRTRPSEVIDFGEAIDEGEVVYFYLNVQEDGSPLRQLAAIILATLVSAAKQKLSSGRSPVPIYVVIDEFFHIAGKSFGDLLATVREWGVHFVLANQNSAQLKGHDANLPSVIHTNTVIKQFFSAVNEDEIDFLREASGIKKDFLRSTSVTGKRQSFSVAEQQSWHLNTDQIMGISDRQLLSALVVDDGMVRAPGSRVRVVQALYPLSRLQYEVNHITPLPKWPNPAEPIQEKQDMRSPTPPSDIERPTERPRKVPSRSLNAEKLEARMRKLFQELSAMNAA